MFVVTHCYCPLWYYVCREKCGWCFPETVSFTRLHGVQTQKASALSDVRCDM